MEPMDYMLFRSDLQLKPRRNRGYLRAALLSLALALAVVAVWWVA